MVCGMVDTDLIFIYPLTMTAKSICKNMIYMYYMKERQSQTFFFDFTISFSPLSRKVKDWNTRQMQLMETADRRLYYFIAVTAVD